LAAGLDDGLEVGAGELEEDEDVLRGDDPLLLRLHKDLLLIHPQVPRVVFDVVVLVPEDGVEDPGEAGLDVEVEAVAIDEERKQVGD